MRKILLFTILASFTFAVKAQEPFTSADILTTIGTNFTVYPTFGQQPGQPGNGQVWDFSDLTSSSTIGTEIVETGSTSPNANYPEANHIFSYNDEVAFEYFILSDSSFDYYGQFQSGGIEMFYTDPVSYTRFPMNYEEAFLDSFASSYSLPGASGDIIGTYDAVVDGYGILKLPWGDLDAYRVTAQVSQTEVFTNANGTYDGGVVGVTTLWFAAGFPAPVMQINDGIISIPQLNIQQSQHLTNYLGGFDFVGVDEIEIVNDLRVFPNPATDYCNISFSKTSSEAVSIEIYDIRGRKLKAISGIGGGTGDFNNRIDVQDIPAGYYLLILKSEKGKQGLKIAVR